jgi:gliding motility-associated-like protein
LDSNHLAKNAILMKHQYTSFTRSRFFLCALFFLGIVFPVHAQIVISSGVSTGTLISSLIGQGMTVSNINLNCPAAAYGTFSNGNTTNIGITSGIMLTTGSCANVIGPNNITSAGTCNGTSFTDPQLVALEPAATYDPCILEFDIIPECNTLTISFVFGSEEYPEFVGAGFNDVFGFFITGPGPACQSGFYNNTNVATLPNNSTLVSIDNVNNVTNSAYYVDNTGGTTIQYDGFTTVLTRTILLCPCQTYHWKLAIADAGDCIYDSGVFIDFLTCANALTVSTTQVNAGCTCTGSATVNLVGGTGPFTYSWAPSGGTAATATGLCPGTYTCTVTDALSCSPPSTVAVTISGTAMTLSPAQNNVTCNGGCNGSATTTIVTGTGPYTYAWAPSGGTGATATGLCPGTYTCTVTGSGGCTATQSFTITQPSALTSSASSTAATCGGSNGSATVVPGGGSPGYTYAWAPSGGSAATAIGLSTGTYTCTITDVNGCTITQTVTVASTGGMSASTTAFADISCFGGSNGTATASPSGGNGPYTYVWSPSGGNAATATGLGIGSYTCTITDANGCTGTTTATITEPTQLTLAAAGFNVSCYGSCDGQLVVIPSGGTPTYSFSWTNGCTAASCNNNCAGSYTVTVLDANGCTSNSAVTITEPLDIVATPSSVDANCNQADGSASVTAVGGTGVLSYQWIGGPANQNYNNIAAGIYSVIVTDANGCDDTATVTVNNLNGVLTSLNAATDISCFGLTDGSIDIDASGGNPGYTYVWSPAASSSDIATNLAAGVYTITATDAVGCTSTITVTLTQPTAVAVAASANPGAICQGTSTQISAVGSGGTPTYSYNWTSLGAGATHNISPTATTTYTVTATDANGCTASATVITTVNPNPTALLSANITSGCAPLCVSFADLSTVNGGTLASWSWDFGDGTGTSQNPTHCYNAPGIYSILLTVTTTDGCTNTITIPSYIEVYALPVAGFTATPQPATMLNSNIAFTDTSTNANTWEWTFGDVPSSTSNQQNPSFLYTEPDCYQVTLQVTSLDGCVDTTRKEICIEPDVAIFVPNTFTPNGDGINETFFPLGVGLDPNKFDLWIFDRWGNLIYYTDDINSGWDGKVQGHSDLCQEDTYVWKIKVIDVKGYKYNMIGQVNLIR